MNGYSTKMSKNKALDLAWFLPIRRFSDGITFFKWEVNIDLFKGDHNPKFTIHLVILNCTIIELNIYDTRHKGN